MTEVTISFLSHKFGYYENGKTLKTSLPFLPEKGDYIKLEEHSPLYYVVGRSFSPSGSPITLYVTEGTNIKTIGQQEKEEANNKRLEAERIQAQQAEEQAAQERALERAKAREAERKKAEEAKAALKYDSFGRVIKS